MSRAPTIEKKNQWFRFYVETLDNPKVQKLSGELFKTWANLLCLASLGDGGLPPVEDIAFRLRLPVRTVESRLSQLVAAGLMDVSRHDSDVIVTPHNWSKRQFASDCSTDRVKKFRESKIKEIETIRNVSETPNATFRKRRMKHFDSASASDSESVSEILSSQVVESTELDTCSAPTGLAVNRGGRS